MDLIISSNAFFTYTGGNVVEKIDAILHTEVRESVIEEFD